jgi:hypothetical protein
MHRQILTPLVVLFAFASLVMAVPTVKADPQSRYQPVSGPPDPWQQSLSAQKRLENVQAVDPWQANLFARQAYETRKLGLTSQPASTGGFGWDDAGIGAGIVLGTLLVGTAGVVTIRRNRRPIAH